MSDTKSGSKASDAILPLAANALPSSCDSASSEPTESEPALIAYDGVVDREDAGENSPFFDERQDTVISKKPPVRDLEEPRPFSPLEMGVALLGQRLGHFELEEFVGGGGMGAVFRARDTSLDRTVAVKVLSRDHADPDIHRRFRNEAQSAARLDHDNISRVFYVGQDKGWNYIVFEYVDGSNIRDIVAKRGALPLAEAISYTLQVAEALEHAFRRDVVHRDIKPSNVLITPNGHVKLVDMGLARLHQVETPDSDITASGVTLGTFDYISPEQARDPRMADVRSDLYSLGCTLYFMLTGRPPFPEGTVLQKLLSHTSDERPDPRLYRPDLPEEITEILNKLLARRTEQRYQEPNELIGELLLVSDHLGIPNTGHRGRIWVTRAAKQTTWIERMAPIAVPLALLLLAVWGLTGFFSGPGDDATDGRVRNLRPEATEGGELETKSGARNEPGKVVADPVPKTDSADKSRSNGGQVTEPPTIEENSLTRREPTGTANSQQTLPTAGRERNVFDDLLFEGLRGATTGTDAAAEISLPSSVGGVSEGAAVAAQLDGNDVFTARGDTRLLLPPAEVRRLVVATEPPPTLAIDDRHYRSLGQAVQSLDLFPNLEVIELRFSDRMQETPLQITASNLTIQAGAGYSPVIEFRPGEGELAMGTNMLQLVGGNISFLNVHLEMTLPVEASSGGWSLFELSQVSSLNLRQSSMTIRNGYDDSSSIHPDVAFFRVSVPPSLKMMAMPGDTPPMPMTPVIDLRRCIARGEATLVRMPEVTPLRLSWNEGLLATSERLLEARGAATATDRDRPIEIDLIHVTAAMAQGMCRLVGETDAQNQLNLDIECSACIFLIHADSPLIEHIGVRDVEEVKSGWLRYRGNNFYPTFEGVSGITCWRIVPLGNSQNELVLTSDDREKPWWEGTVQYMVMWENSPAHGPVFHQHIPFDYLLVDELRNPPIQFAEEHRNAGFDLKTLPSLPDYPPSSPEGVSSIDSTSETSAEN